MVRNQGLYAYGVIGEKPQPSFTIAGIDKTNSVYPIAGKDICVIVSEIDIDIFQNQVKSLLSGLTGFADNVPGGTEEILQAHEDVVGALMESTTVVPFTFGTVLKDEAAATTLLLDDEAKFKKLLAKFADRAEWGVKVYADNQRFIKYALGSEAKNSVAANVSQGTAYLLGKKLEEETKEHAAIQLANINEHIFQELEKYAYEGMLNKTLPQKLTGKKHEMVLNTAFLVEKENVARFCQQEKILMEKYAPMGLELEMSGPWAAYSFIS